MKHCLHTTTRATTMCDYCCRCGNMFWTRLANPGETLANPAHGPHHVDNRIIDRPDLAEGECHPA